MLVFALFHNGKCQNAFDDMLSDRKIAVSQFSTNRDELTTANFNTDLAPKVYPAYIYPHFYKYKEVYRNKKWNCTIKYLIKNKGDDKWFIWQFNTKVKFSTWDNDSLVLLMTFATHDESKYHEGFISNSKLPSNLSGWYPHSPTLYKLAVDYNYEYPDYSGVYVRRVGVREVSVNSQNQLILNGSALKLRTTALDTDAVNDKTLIQTFKDIKKHYLNAVIIRGKIPDDLLEVSDKIGLLVINKLDDSSFTDFRDFIQYYFKVYTSPSLIGWELTNGFKYYKDLKSIDPERPISSDFKNYIKLENWTKVSSEQKLSIKNTFSPYSIDINPSNGIVKLKKLRELFIDVPLSLKFEVLSNDQVQLLDSMKINSKNDLEIDLRKIDLTNGKNIMCKLSLVAVANGFLYNKGDVLYMKTYYINDGIITGIEEEK